MLSKIALKLPGFDINVQTKDAYPGFKPNITGATSLVSTALELVFFAVGFLVLLNLVLGAFRYLSAADSKENVQKARQRIIWSIVGFLVLIAAFSVAEFTRTIIPQQDVTLTKVQSTEKDQTSGAPVKKVDSKVDGYGGCCDAGDGDKPEAGCPTTQECTFQNGTCSSGFSCVGKTLINSEKDGPKGCCNLGLDEGDPSGCPKGLTCSNDNGACASGFTCQ